MNRLSVVIITFNEERNLARCLESVKKVADEILVVDTLSTDSTVAIAKTYGAKIIDQAFMGYGQQKNFATDNATYDWVLSLDADEVLTTRLEESILNIKRQPGANAYYIPRLTNYCGKWIKHCGWYPDHQLRLYNRTQGRWKEEKVHESWRPSNTNEKIETLKGDLLHYSFNTIEDHLKKINRYTELAAVTAVEKGKSASLFKIWLSPKWHFFTEYFIKLGFLDGFYGYIICKLSAYSAFLKYSRIRIKAKEKGQRPYS